MGLPSFAEKERGDALRNVADRSRSREEVIRSREEEGNRLQEREREEAMHSKEGYWIFFADRVSRERRGCRFFWIFFITAA